MEVDLTAESALLHSTTTPHLEIIGSGVKLFCSFLHLFHDFASMGCEDASVGIERRIELQMASKAKHHLVKTVANKELRFGSLTKSRWDNVEVLTGERSCSDKRLSLDVHMIILLAEEESTVGGETRIADNGDNSLVGIRRLFDGIELWRRVRDVHR